MKKRILLPFLTLFLFVGASAQTVVPAILTGTHVWDSTGNPYLITQSTLIDTGASVKVMPGVIIDTDSTGPQQLYVDGEFQILGSASDPVTVSMVGIQYRATAKDYVDSTKEGAYMTHLIYYGNGSTTVRGIQISKTDFRIENSELNNVFYGIYPQSSGSTSNIEILDCDFHTGDYGYPIYANSSYDNIRVEGCNVYGGSVYAYGGVTFKHNYLYDMDRVHFYNFNGLDIQCNTFRLMAYSVKIQKTGTNKSAGIIFRDNTLDSIGYQYSNYPMLHFYSYPLYVDPSNIHFNNNNFLTVLKDNFKVAIDGYNNNMTTSDTLDFSGNYWGTTDSATIASYIEDYTDDISIFGYADWTGPLSSMSTTCPSGPCNAEISYVLEGHVLSVTDASTGPDGYSVSWDFGDGSTASTPNAGHTYTESGTYTVRLRITDSLSGCTDEDSITVTVFVSSCQASFYFAVDSSQSYNLYLINTSTGVTSYTNYYWTFGDGTGSSAQTPSHTYSAFGVYQICLTLFDSATNCYSTYCDSVGMDSTGQLLKNDGFTIHVLNAKDVLSAPDIQEAYDLRVFPNPAHDKVHLRFDLLLPSQVTIQITDLNGRTVHHRDVLGASGTNQVELDLAELPAGMYFIQLNSEQGTARLRILRQ